MINFQVPISVWARHNFNLFNIFNFVRVQVYWADDSCASVSSTQSNNKNHNNCVKNSDDRYVNSRALKQSVSLNSFLPKTKFENQNFPKFRSCPVSPVAGVGNDDFEERGNHHINQIFMSNFKISKFKCGILKHNRRFPRSLSHGMLPIRARTVERICLILNLSKIN